MAQFTNQATLTYNGITANSNVVTGEITQVLSVWKDATVDTYEPGKVLTYVISLQNSGTNDIHGLTVTDNLGAYPFGTGTLVPLTYTGDPVLYYLNGILQTAPAVAAGPPLTVSGISVLAGTSSMLVYRVLVNDFAPLGTGETIENTVTVTGGLATRLTATETVTMRSSPNLNIIKALNPPNVVENGQLTYTFTIQNTGPAAATAAAGIIISDTFDPPLSGISATLNGAVWPAAGNYSYNEATGVFATRAGQITVPAATYTQNPVTGRWSVVPKVAVLTVTGTV